MKYFYHKFFFFSELGFFLHCGLVAVAVLPRLIVGGKGGLGEEKKKKK
jgi:hypothetical protein